MEPTHMLMLAETDPNKVTPGLLGFVVFAVLAVAVWLLMRSMNGHMGRVRFDEEQPPVAGGGRSTAKTSTES